MSTAGLKRWKVPLGFSVLACFAHPLYKTQRKLYFPDDIELCQKIQLKGSSC